MAFVFHLAFALLPRSITSLLPTALNHLAGRYDNNVHGSAAVNSVYGGRHTHYSTAVSSAVDGRRTTTFFTPIHKLYSCVFFENHHICNTFAS
ncbi:MAG: hypothetical protein HXL36_02245 [Prevotellaceae bacterium]|nr:hypothetical protein [Prevotellaceae bacterium]